MPGPQQSQREYEETREKGQSYWHPMAKLEYIFQDQKEPYQAVLHKNLSHLANIWSSNEYCRMRDSEDLDRTWQLTFECLGFDIANLMSFVLMAQQGPAGRALCNFLLYMFLAPSRINLQMKYVHLACDYQRIMKIARMHLDQPPMFHWHLKTWHPCKTLNGDWWILTHFGRGCEAQHPRKWSHDDRKELERRAWNFYSIDMRLMNRWIAPAAPGAPGAPGAHDVAPAAPGAPGAPGAPEVASRGVKRADVAPGAHDVAPDVALGAPGMSSGMSKACKTVKEEMQIIPGAPPLGQDWTDCGLFESHQELIFDGNLKPSAPPAEVVAIESEEEGPSPWDGAQFVVASSSEGPSPLDAQLEVIASSDVEEEEKAETVAPGALTAPPVEVVHRPNWLQNMFPMLRGIGQARTTGTGSRSSHEL